MPIESNIHACFVTAGQAAAAAGQPPGQMLSKILSCWHSTDNLQGHQHQWFDKCNVSKPGHAVLVTSESDLQCWLACVDDADTVLLPRSQCPAYSPVSPAASLTAAAVAAATDVLMKTLLHLSACKLCSKLLADTPLAETSDPTLCV